MAMYCVKQECGNMVETIATATTKRKIESLFNATRRSFKKLGYQVYDNRIGYFTAWKCLEFCKVEYEVYIQRLS